LNSTLEVRIGLKGTSSSGKEMTIDGLFQKSGTALIHVYLTMSCNRRTTLSFASEIMFQFPCYWSSLRVIPKF